MSVQVRGDLIKSGFVANNEKIVWKPVQSIEWLGFIWNLSSGTLEISQKKFETLKNIILALVEGSLPLTYRNLAKVCGKIISMMPALGNICQIMTRHLHMAICCRNYWDSVIEFNDNIVQELRFWYFHAESIDFRCVTPFYRKFERIIFF